MRVTNVHGLPQPLVRAVENDPYDMGAARISVTGLLRPPRITLLHKRHSPEIVSDVSDHIYRLMGRALHKILEDNGTSDDHQTEERLYADVRGWRISGQIDLQKHGNKVSLTDYKSTSAYSVMKEKEEWQTQLNFYAFLVREAKGLEVDKLAICAIVRNWNRHKAKEDPDYPQAPAVMVPVPLWSHDEATRFVEGRVRLHQEAIALTDMGEDPPLCTDAERWMRPASWAVIRAGNKRPTKVFDSAQGYEDWLATRNDADAFRVDHRPGEPIRCVNNFCQVAPWCKQHAKWLKENDNA